MKALPKQWPNNGGSMAKKTGAKTKIRTKEEILTFSKEFLKGYKAGWDEAWAEINRRFDALQIKWKKEGKL